MVSMINLENNLTKAILEGNTNLAIKIYNKLFKEFSILHKDTENLLRLSQLFLLTLNGVIYKSLYSKPICKRSLYEERTYNIIKIDSSNSIEELNNNFNEIIISYSKLNSNINYLPHNPIIKQAIAYINNNIGGDLSLNTVANKIHISKNYLSFLFTKFVGSSFSDYVNKKRVEKSKSLLVEENSSVLDIAIQCGFSSQSYFCSVFKKHENMTPKQFQNSQRF